MDRLWSQTVGPGRRPARLAVVRCASYLVHARAWMRGKEGQRIADVPDRVRIFGAIPRLGSPPDSA